MRSTPIAAASPVWALLLSITALAALAPHAAAQQNTTAMLTDGQGLTVQVSTNGLVDIAADGDVFTFEDVPPFVVRATLVAGGKVSWSEFRGSEFAVAAKTVTSLSPLRCALTWRACSFPGIAGTCDLVWTYELLPGRRAISLRGTLANSSLATGLATISYRQYLRADCTPQTVTGGFSGAVHVGIDQLQASRWNPQHPFFLTGGRLSLGASAPEDFMATRTGETTFIAATHDVDRRQGLLLSRDDRADPENTGRETGFFGVNAITSSTPQFGFGCSSYLPNDHQPANGGLPLSIGAGLLLELFARENDNEPWWDVVRAYRSRHVEPLLRNEHKTAERAPWAGRAVYIVLNVHDTGAVAEAAAAAFVDEFLAYYASVTDVCLLLWGATDVETFQPLPGLDQLMQKLRALEIKHAKAIHTALYYLPSSYQSDGSGGTRRDQVALDLFGNPLRYAIAGTNEFVWPVNLSGAPAKDFYLRWLPTVLGATGASGVYFDDATRDRQFYSSHYGLDSEVLLQGGGRTPAMVEGYLWHMRATRDHFVRLKQPSFLITELGILGQSVPGNLTQGVAGLQNAGPFFVDPREELQMLPLLNDVAGRHWLCGYAGPLSHEWIELADYADVPYYSAQVVRGLVPMQSPVALNGRYMDFFQVCRYGVVDCNKPRFRALGYCSQFADRAIGFRAAHEAILSDWEREPLPGTHDIRKHHVLFQATYIVPAYQVAVDEIPFGYFCDPADPRRFALAVANPLEQSRKVHFRLARKRYGLQLNGPYRLTLQLAGDPTVYHLPHKSTATGIDFTLDLPQLQLAMVRLEPIKG